ncbi:hypothetical protein [Sphaerothrix gracilis]|uniref:hypothetical protein n=1 Tax=Sphaerothrix gracilis TaxID=3151835 RepID=UPI0031FDA0B5
MSQQTDSYLRPKTQTSLIEFARDRIPYPAGFAVSAEGIFKPLLPLEWGADKDRSKEIN